MEGLAKFREAFEAYSENYVIIGGTACDIAMTGTAVRPRATHDIDMIVIVEKMTTDFANTSGSSCVKAVIALKSASSLKGKLLSTNYTASSMANLTIPK